MNDNNGKDDANPSVVEGNETPKSHAKDDAEECRKRGQALQ